jgi:hypothetical protein
MTNKRIYIISGIAFCFFALIGLQHDIKSYEVQKTGKFIEVTITDIPNCIGTRVKHHIRFEYFYKGSVRTDSKPIGSVLCEKLELGQKLKMKTDSRREIFLYESEDVRTEFYASGIMGIFGLACIVLGIRKKK